jgi:hypothetical protein
MEKKSLGSVQKAEREVEFPELLPASEYIHVAAARPKCTLCSAKNRMKNKNLRGALEACTS